MLRAKCLQTASVGSGKYISLTLLLSPPYSRITFILPYLQPSLIMVYYLNKILRLFNSKILFKIPESICSCIRNISLTALRRETNMASTTTNWKDDILRKLKHRNKTQAGPYAKLITASTYMLIVDAHIFKG